MKIQDQEDETKPVTRAIDKRKKGRGLGGHF